MASVKFMLRDKKAKNKSLIRLSFSFKGERINLCTKESINPSDWDEATGFAKEEKSNKELKTLNNTLNKIKSSLTDVYNRKSEFDNIKVVSNDLKFEFNKIINPEKYKEVIKIDKTGIVDFIDEFISDCEKGKRLHSKNRTRLTETTIQTHRTTRLHFINFQKKYQKRYLLNNINQNVFDDFLYYLEIELELSKNSVSKQFINFRQFILYAIEKKVLPKAIMVDLTFYTTREDSDNIYLTEKEIEYFINLSEFNSKQEEEVRDMFVLGCYTGLRWGNFSTFNPDYIQDGVYSTVQSKVDCKVSLPIHPIVYDILNKYKNKLPVCPTNQEFNRTIKDLGKRIPELHIPFVKLITRGREVIKEEGMKYEFIMTHTARRSFCTNMYLLGVPVLTIMSASGHKTEKNFKKYMKASSLQHAEIMKGFWEKK